MNDAENARSRAEALEATSRVTASARRNRLWAGLNRYLASESAHAHKAAVSDRRAEQPAPDDTTSDSR